MKKPKRNRLHAYLTLLVVIGFSALGYFAIDSSLFRLNQVNVESLSEHYPISIEQVLDTAKVPLGKFSLFSINLKPIEDRLTKNPWVKGVIISKQFPNTLVLKIVERNPVSLLNEVNGRVLYIEDDGATFEDRAMVYSKELPMISGFSANDAEKLKRINQFLDSWFGNTGMEKLKVSSISFDPKNGLKAMIVFPLKNNQSMRAVLELGQNIEEASVIPQDRFKKILSYLHDKSIPASKIWLGDGKKIVVKVARGS